MSLVELMCPGCGQGLAPREGQVIHACASCGASYEAVSGHGLIPVARQIVRPRIAPRDGASLVLMPVWCITVHRERMGEISGRMASEIRIPATGIARMPLLVAAARRLTSAAAPREVWSGVEAIVDPAEIDAETAFAIAESVALRHVSGWPHERDLESVEIPLGGACLVDWPCAVEGSDFVELVGGLSIPAALGENIGPRDQRVALSSSIKGLNLPGKFRPTHANS